MGDENVVSAEIQVKNKSGLHMRPASELSKLARQCQSDIVIISGEKQINPKSILVLMSAAIKKGATVTVQCSGETEEQDLKTLLDAIGSGLGEGVEETP